MADVKKVVNFDTPDQFGQMSKDVLLMSTRIPMAADGIGAIVAAAGLVSMLQTLVSRRVDPMENAVLTIGTIAGGAKRNIVCDDVRLTLTMRTFTDEVYETMMDGVRGVLRAVECAFNVETRLAFEGPDYLAVVNDAELAEDYRKAVGGAGCGRWPDPRAHEQQLRFCRAGRY